MLKLSKLNHTVKHCFLTGSILILIACDQGMSEQRMLQNAKTYLNRGELRAATIELQNTLQKNNKNAEAHYLLGSISLKIGDLARAKKEFSQAALAGWNKEEAQTGLARTFISRKEFQKLLDEIIIINTWSPATQANISALRALAEASLGHPPQAKATLDKGRAYQENALQVLKTTIIFQLSGMQDGDASDTLKTALSLYPENPELLLLQASNDLQNNHHSQASSTYKKIISLDPPKLITFNGQKAHIGLARLQIIEKNYNQANKTLSPLLKRNDKDPEANYLGGLLAFSQGDYSRAENHVRKLLVIAPDSSQAQQLMGKIKYALNDFNQAARHLSACLNTKPDDIAVRKLLAHTYIILNQPEQARLTLQDALTANPNDAATLTLLSQIEFKEGNMKAGIQALGKAIKFSPDNAQLHKLLVKAYIATDQTELAQSELKIFQSLSNNTEEAQKLAISAHLQAGQIEKAIDIANQMLSSKPKNPNILTLIGSLYADNGNNQQARIHFNKAKQIQENHPAATIGLARIEQKNGNFDKAIELYKGLVESNAAGTIAMMQLSKIAAQQKRTNDMLSWLEKARAAAPTETKSRIILAKHYLQNAQPKKAEIYNNEALKQSPEQAELIALQGKILIAQQRYSEALPPLKKLASKQPKSIVAQTLLGEAFLRQRMLKNAREHLQQALTIQKDHVIAISLLAETELKDGNIDKSLEYAKTLQKELPEQYIGHMQEGDAWMAKRDYQRAYSAYSKAWKQQQTAQLAKRLFSASKQFLSFDNAIKPLLTWLNDNPGDDATRFYLATKYQNAKDSDRAIREYEKILAQTPANSAALNNLAWLYSLNANPKALDMAERAYRLAPENPGILDTYGWTLVQNNQAKKGKRLIQQALELIPDNLEINYHYAVALLRSGEKDKGKQILDKILKQDKPFDSRGDAKQLLGTL